MSANQVTTYLKYANLQMAAEAFYGLKNQPPETKFFGTISEKMLTDGNERSSRFTEIQAKEFTKEWTVLEHTSNTKTGFSGTLFKYIGQDDPSRDLRAGELVISFRSTEFLDDAARDNQATNAMEIKPFGWSFGQIADMEDWYAKLNADPGKLGGSKPFSVTGYSLGGHLATAFTQLRYEQAESTRVNATYTFNGAGVGGINNRNTVTLTSIISQFNAERKSGAGISFSDPDLQKLYVNLSTQLKGGAEVTTAHFDEFWKLQPAALKGDERYLTPEKKMMLQALQRIKTIQGEAVRAPGLSSGDGSLPPQNIITSNIEGTSLNYQLAVLRAKEKTYATQDNGGPCWQIPQLLRHQRRYLSRCRFAFAIPLWN